MTSTVQLLFLLATTLSLVTAYSFDLTAAPTQCGLLSLAITQGQGNPPYSALIVPFGASPTETEVRVVIQHNFTTAKATLQLPYPANAGFVIMMSDSNGTATGGTSAPITVGASATNDSSCLPESVVGTSSFHIIPNNTINQCQEATLAWSHVDIFFPRIFLIIPGGQSSLIRMSDTDEIDQFGLLPSNFSWTPSIRAGTNIILVALDTIIVALDNGRGDWGSSVNIAVAVGNGPDSCINSTSPSSTAGTPAGAVQTDTVQTDTVQTGTVQTGTVQTGTVQTGTVQTGNGNDNNNNNNNDGGGSGSVAAIAGGIVGGLALVIIGLVGFLRRRKRVHHDSVDLLTDVNDDGSAAGHGDAPPEFEPYIVSSIGGNTHSRNVSTKDGAATGTIRRPKRSDIGRRYSALSTTDQDGDRNVSESTRTKTGPFLGGGSGSGGRSGRTSHSYSHTQTSRMGALGPTLRPVNWVQHEDAGGVPEEGNAPQPETIDVPPSYNNIRR